MNMDKQMLRTTITQLRQIALFAVGVSLLTACGNNQSGMKLGDNEFAVLAVNSTTSDQTTSYPATIRGTQDIEVRPQVSGFIVKLCVDEGATVRKGQALFQIDPTQYAAAVGQAKAAVEMAKANVATLTLTEKNKKALLKKEEIKIRQSIGEAVPTNIFFQIAENIKNFMEQEHFTTAIINKTIENYKLEDAENLIKFIQNNPLNLGNASLARIAELTNSKRENNAAYYTNKFILNEIFKELPSIEKDVITILEPSVGIGNFLPFIFKKYEETKEVNIDVVDIDGRNLEILRLLLAKQKIPSNMKLNFIQADTLLYDFNKHYDLVIGNPPFSKLKSKDAAKYLKNNINKETTNTFEFFLEKAMTLSDYVVMITPKAVLNTPEFRKTRDLLATKKIDCIQDYGENGFKGVLVETICLFVDTNEKPNETKVESLTLKKTVVQKQKYITDKEYPYWIIYRDDFFDGISQRLDFDKFTVFRDRQITNSNTTQDKGKDCLRVIKSRNISDDGKEIIDIPGYDSYIKKDTVENLSAYKFVGNQNVYLTPNMTYKPRVMRNSGNVVVNGSVAVLIPKEKMALSERQMEYFSSAEYRKFYQIARNYQTRSLNVDATSVFFYGVLKECCNG